MLARDVTFARMRALYAEEARAHGTDELTHHQLTEHWANCRRQLSDAREPSQAATPLSGDGGGSSGSVPAASMVGSAHGVTEGMSAADPAPAPLATHSTAGDLRGLAAEEMSMVLRDGRLGQLVRDAMRGSCGVAGSPAPTAPDHAAFSATVPDDTCAVVPALPISAGAGPVAPTATLARRRLRTSADE